MKRFLPYLLGVVIFVLICGSMIHNKKDRFAGIETSTENTGGTTESDNKEMSDDLEYLDYIKF